jgi:DNA uptake protein ComE-like DNA-binding protein
MAQLNGLYDAAAAKLSSLTEQAKAFVGIGGATVTAPAVRAVPVQQQQPQTVQGGALGSATATAKADTLTLSADATAAGNAVMKQIPQMTVKTVEAGTAATQTAAAMGTVTKASQEEIKALFDVGEATQQAIDHMAHFRDAFANSFDDLLDGKKFDWKSLAKGFQSSMISSLTGGKATTPGQMLSGALFGYGGNGAGAQGGGSGAGGGLLSGLFNTGGSGGGGMVPATGGFAGGGGANAILGGGGGGKIGNALDMAQSVGGMLGKGGALSKIPGLAKAGGFLTKLPGIGGFLGKLGGLFGMGGGGAAAGGAAGAGGAEPGIPDKFVVKDAAGQIDHAATALKLAREGYLPLEKRLGSGDAPPHSIDGYKVNVPEAFKETVKAEELSNDPAFKDFLGKAHAAGLNQKQVDLVLGEFLDRSTKMQAALPQLAAADCEAELRQGDGWKTDEQYKQQVSTAFTAGKAIFGKDFDGIVKDYGNDPRLIRGLASIGKEMQEDMPASPEAQAQIQENLDQLMASKSYLNANDPQHAATMAKVSALTAKLAGQRPVQGGRTHSFKTA